jgi:hypothetical protein
MSPPNAVKKAANSTVGMAPAAGVVSEAEEAIEIEAPVPILDLPRPNPLDSGTPAAMATFFSNPRRACGSHRPGAISRAAHTNGPALDFARRLDQLSKLQRWRKVPGRPRIQRPDVWN